MTTVQQIRQKQDVSDKVSISQEQSQKLVQTMMTMCFGCLAFLRGLFPDDNFVDQKFVPEKCRKDYDKNSASSIRIKTLVRNRSEEANLFLDWLENGVFQSLKKGYLRAISLGIFINENAPTDLIENYLFSFEYADNHVVLKINEQAENVSLLDSRKMAQQLMRRFIIITQSLDPLPEKRFLTMRLMFNDSAPKDYQPQLFRDATREPKCLIRIPQQHSLDTFAVGALNTSKHKVGLKVLSLADNAIQQQLANGLMTEIDPFDLIDENIELPKDSQIPIERRETFQSQTTKMLQNYLKSSPMKFEPTQMMEASENTSEVDCECGFKRPLSISPKQIKCLTCKKLVHALCYGNSKSSNVHACFECLGKNKIDFQGFNFQRFMITRKIYRYMAKKPEFPRSLSHFYSIFLGNEGSIKLKAIINDCISILLLDEVFIIEPSIRTGHAGTPLRSSGYVQVDEQVLNTPTGTLSQGTYAWTFVRKPPGAHDFYAEPCAKSEEHFLDLLEKCERSFGRLKNLVIDDSLTLDSLSLNGDKISKHNRGMRKRKHKEKEGSNDESSIDSQAESGDKVRKISVSKKTLRSSW